MSTVIDTAGLADPQGIKDAGHAGLVAYVSPSRPGSNFAGKPIQADYVDRLQGLGLDVAANWQYGKPGGTAPSDWRSGRDGGRRMASEARERAFVAGMPGWCPIFFSVDEDVSLADWNGAAVEWFRGINDVIGVEWTGIYSHSRAAAWAIEDGVIGRSTTPGKFWIWQTRAWSGGEIAAEAVLYQRVIDTPSSPGPIVGGTRVDVNDVLAPDWGQWSLDRSPGVIPVTPPNPGGPVDAGVTVQMIGRNKSARHAYDYIVIHTQQGGRGDARGLANYCNGTSGASAVSYNVATDDVDTVQIVEDHMAPWSAAEANPIGLHVCLAGSYAEWPRGKWLETDASDSLNESAMLDRTARWVAAKAQEHGIPVEYVGDGGQAGWPRAPRGICGHMDFGRRGGGHWDPGHEFPWDELLKRVLGHLAPPANLIDQAAEIAKAWIGRRLTEGEHHLDAGGRWADFENAAIYWTEATGAHPVPRGGLWEAWAEYGWESGPLGYPVRDHAVVEGGGVQAFQGGVLYRQDGAEHGFYVHGAIGERYAREGYERGPLGWPISNEYDTATGGRRQDFEHGIMFWDPSGVVQALSKE